MLMDPITADLVLRMEPDAVIRDSGAAKIKELDRRFYDAFAARFGVETIRQQGLGAMEANWVATNTALYYVNPRLEMAARWTWRELMIRMGRRLWRFQHLHLHTKDEGLLEMSLGRLAAESMLKVAAERGADIVR